MAFHKPPEHGDRCTCRLLAMAVSGDPKTSTYNYCKAVLQKRWIMECNHGCCHEPEKAPPSDKWHDLGPIDPIKAILISNESP